MNDFYIFFRNRENIEQLNIEHIEADTKDKAKFNFVKKYGYDMNQAFSFMTIIISDIKDAYEYKQYLETEYNKQSEKKNAKKWINKLNQLLSNEINSFKIKKVNYQAFCRVLERNNLVGKITVTNMSDKKTKQYIIMSEENALKRLI